MILKKIKKLEPLIKIKKNKLNSELQKLSHLQNSLQENEKLLILRQGQYLKSSKDLNKIVETTNRQGYEIAAGGVDYLREEWSYLFRNKKKIEKDIETQKHAVRIAYDQHENIKRLQKKYIDNWHQELRKKDMAELDEKVLRLSLKSEEGLK